MAETTTRPVGCVQYELEIAIDAPCERVWQAMIHETNFWWLPDFHMVGEGSVVSFDPAPGGRGLVESLDGNGGLLWYSVHYYAPEEFKIYLVGHIAPDWGGPSTSHLKLALEEASGGCVLKVSDAQHGNVSEGTVKSLSDGWMQLFTGGLKEFVENGTTQVN